MSQPQSFTEQEFHRFLQPKLNKVFQALDPFGTPFQDSVESRAILYPIGYQLTAFELNALMVACQAVGDTVINVTITERPKEPDHKHLYHWQVRCEQMNDYYQIDRFLSVLESAIYSDTGVWGLLISHERHAVVGGTAKFMNTFLQALEVDSDEQVEEFVQNWQRNQLELTSDIRWLFPLLVHILGIDKAQKLIME